MACQIWVDGLTFLAMKTTLEIADSLLRRMKALAKKQNLTLKELTEEGLEMVLRARSRRKPYKAKPVVFNGKGRSPEFRDASWSSLRDAAYQGRGG